ncbi:hypothetical protein OF83DRAFT_1058912 [Amylostereum chailletii]|nr:hypothetical protein OF83DRAFT_1058912 [Amylostereum chailletii]
MSQEADLEAARDADTEYLVRRSMTKGYQLFSVLTPPAYATFVILRRGRGQLTINRLLRATWLGGATVSTSVQGLVAGGAFGYTRSVTANPETLRARRIRAAFDMDSMRADDHATIGALLFSVLTPAMFWKRATTIHLIFGGAGLGTAVGWATHIGRHIFGDPAPKAQIPVPTQDP